MPNLNMEEVSSVYTLNYVYIHVKSHAHLNRIIPLQVNAKEEDKKSGGARCEQLSRMISGRIYQLQIGRHPMTSCWHAGAVHA